MNTVLLTPEQVANLWPQLSQPLQTALSHGQDETPLIEYLRRALDYRAQIWVFTNDDQQIMGTGITQFIDYQTHKTLHIVACAGIEWDSWADQYYIVEEFAKKNGCKAVEQWGRPGWAKLLPAKIPGFKTAYHVMRKEIEVS